MDKVYKRSDSDRGTMFDKIKTCSFYPSADNKLVRNIILNDNKVTNGRNIGNKKFSPLAIVFTLTFQFSNFCTQT
jgi:hypothetical protein